MKKLILTAAALLCAFAGQAANPRVDHVIFIGFDAMSARGVQRAKTPNFNYMIDNGAVSLHTRCVRETSSSQNWMSMVSGAPVEMHGVLSNGWKRGDSLNVTPALKNGAGLFPTIFDDIRAQKPKYRQYAFIEWAGETRMYDTSAFDSCRVYKQDTRLAEKTDVIKQAFSTYLKDRPEMLFVSMDITDDMGHTYGHESERYLSAITQMDSITGVFVHELERRGWMKNTVIIITADHGGIGFGHGGDTMAEYEIPVIMFGGPVTKGKVMKHANMIYDVGATAAGLLGVDLPWECHGKFIKEAFDPADGDVYVPMPFVRPYSGRATGDISISDDIDGAKIYYTLDGSRPDESATLYQGPFRIDKASRIRSVAYRRGCRSMEADNYLSPDSFEAPVAYRLYLNIPDRTMPDFTKFGKPSAEGFVDNFSLDQFDLAKVDHFAILFTSNLLVPKDAHYKFELRSDDGADVYIDGRLIVGTDAHSMVETSGAADLKAGKHIIKVEFYEVSSVQDLRLSCSIDGSPFRPLLASDLDR